jgi:hypothetical protein
LKKELIVLFIIFLVAENSFSQKIFREGYIVKNTGDTFMGLLEFSPNQKIPSLCVFKRFDIAVKISYSPGEVKAFGYLNGKRFESKSYKNKQAFYEVLVTGNINLYNKGSKYFIEEENQNMAEIKDGTNTYLSKGETKEFKSLAEFLRYITKGKVADIKDKANIKYDLVTIITDFNKGSGSRYQVYNRSFSEKELARVTVMSGAGKNKFGIVAGFNIYSLSLSPYKAFFFPAAGASFSPEAGISWERMFRLSTGRISLRADLLLFKHNFYSYTERDFQFENISRDDVHFGFTGITLPVLVQYSFTGRKLIPFISAGISATGILKPDYYRVQEEEYPSRGAIMTTEYRDKLFLTDAISGLAGAGIKFRSKTNNWISLQGRVSYGQGLFRISDSLKSFKQHSLQASLLAGFTF